MGNGASVNYSSSQSEPSRRRTSQLSILKSNLLQEKRKHSNLKSKISDDSSSSSSSDYSFESSSLRKRKRQSTRKQRTSLVFNKSKKNEIFLTKEELDDLSAKELRSRCQKFGLDTRTIIEKNSLVNSLYNYYQKCNDENSNFDISYGDDYGQIMEVIYETIPYLGQGNKSLDKFIRENIQRLPVCIICFLNIYFGFEKYTHLTFLFSSLSH